MNALEFLVPISIALGALGLGLFFWAINNRQYEDVVGAAQRIFIDDDDKPL
jgi:cbb3-type cytochrome oxidase maturation protein